MTNVRETDIKSRALYFLDDMINIKNLDPNNINTEILAKIFLFTTVVIGTPNSVQPFYLIINKIDEYTE